MAFVKRGDAEIINIIEDDNKIDDEKTKRALKEARQAAKNIRKDSNKIEFNKESN